jgi:hypothetical protein
MSNYSKMKETIEFANSILDLSHKILYLLLKLFRLLILIQGLKFAGTIIVILKLIGSGL